jgi:hypothetical protein
MDQHHAMSVPVKVCGCRPHEGGSARTVAGVRKPPKEETAGGPGKVARQTLWGFGGWHAVAEVR